MDGKSALIKALQTYFSNRKDVEPAYLPTLKRHEEAILEKARKGELSKDNHNQHHA